MATVIEPMTEPMTEPRPATVRVSVIVVSYNVRDDLRRCLADLRRQVAAYAAGAEVIVVDNESVDGSAAMVRREFSSWLKQGGLKLVLMGFNGGFSAAVNRGAEQARGDFFLLLNPDAVLGHNNLAALVTGLSRCAEDVAVVGPRQVDRDGIFQLSVGPTAHLLLDLTRRYIQRAVDARLLPSLVDRLIGRLGDVPWVAGSCMLIKRAAFTEIGGFDSAYFLFFEDIDFCLRLRQRGHRVRYWPTITISHRRGASAATMPERSAQAYRASQQRFWRQHGGRLRAAVVCWYIERSTAAKSPV